MESQEQWHQHCKFAVLRLMTEQEHSQQPAQASAKKAEEQKRPLEYSPLSFHCPAFVQSHQAEGKEVHSQQKSQQKRF